MCLFQLSYFVLMIAKIGPIGDIDLFFSVYMTFAFVGGLAVDELSRSTAPHRRTLAQNLIISAFVGNTSFLLLPLLILGLPGRI